MGHECRPRGRVDLRHNDHPAVLGIFDESRQFRLGIIQTGASRWQIEPRRTIAVAGLFQCRERRNLRTESEQSVGAHEQMHVGDLIHAVQVHKFVESFQRMEKPSDVPHHGAQRCRRLVRDEHLRHFYWRAGGVEGLQQGHRGPGRSLVIATGQDDIRAIYIECVSLPRECAVDAQGNVARLRKAL